jgi:cellobiose phosphorylase
LLSLLIYPHAKHRADAATLNANSQGQAALWPFGISGDYPILLLRIGDETEGKVLQELLRAHTYWRRRGLTIDLVIFNRKPTNYGRSTHNFIHRMIQHTDSSSWLNQRGGIFVLNEGQMSDTDQTLLHAVARVVLV